MKLENFSDEYYEIVHLTQNIDVSGFRSKKGYGLEVYLKEQAMHDEMGRLSRTYLVLNSETKQIAAYFTLRTGLLIEERRGLLFFVIFLQRNRNSLFRQSYCHGVALEKLRYYIFII